MIEVATPIAAPAAAPAPAAAAPAAAATPPAAPAAGEVPAPSAQPPAPAQATDPKASDAFPQDWNPKLPQGAQLDQKAFSGFKAIIADGKMTLAEKAQALVDFQFAQVSAKAKADAEAFANMKAADLEALKADKDFGGAKFDKSVADARSAEAQFFGEDAAKLFAALGIENHPALVKGLARIRAAISEDSTAGKLGATGPDNSQEARMRQMFPNSWQSMMKVARK